MVTPYEEYVAVAEQLNELTPGSHEKRTALFNSGAEAVENAVKIARHAHRPAGDRRVRPRLPRPHEPDDGADRQEHAVQAPASARSPARSTACRWPTRSAGRPARRTARTRRSRRSPRLVHTQVGEANTAAVIIEPIQGEGGFIVPAPGFLARGRRLVRRATASCSSPTRSRPASAAPATGSRASTRAWCRT